MNKTVAGLAVVCMALGGAVFAQSQTYEVGAFRAIEAKQGVIVDVAVAPDYAVSAVAETGDLAQLKVKEFLPWIVFERDTRWLMFSKWRQDVFAVSIQAPVVNGLKALDDARITFSGDADARLWAEAGDGGVVTLTDVTVRELTLVATQDGQITASGRCDMLNIRAEAAVVDVSGLSCATIVVNGAGAIVLPDDAVVVDAHPQVDG